MLKSNLQSIFSEKRVRKEVGFTNMPSDISMESLIPKITHRRTHKSKDEIEHDLLVLNDPVELRIRVGKMDRILLNKTMVNRMEDKGAKLVKKKEEYLKRIHELEARCVKEPEQKASSKAQDQRVENVMEQMKNLSIPGNLNDKDDEKIFEKYTKKSLKKGVFQFKDIKIKQISFAESVALRQKQLKIEEEHRLAASQARLAALSLEPRSNLRFPINNAR